MNNQKVIIMGAASHDFHNFTPLYPQRIPIRTHGIDEASFPCSE